MGLTSPAPPLRHPPEHSKMSPRDDCYALDTTRVREETFMHPDLVIGKRFPDLTFPDHRKQPVRLSELAKGFPLILSFYRGYW
jgi:hypothetical protein